jgi:hypothetical protein
VDGLDVSQEMCATRLATFEMREIGLLIIVSLACIPLFSIIHGVLNRICFAHVKRYCLSHDIEVTEWRLFPAFDQTGIKTENTQIEIRSDGPGGQKVYRFIVWIFGVRTVTVSPYNANPEEEANKTLHPTATSIQSDFQPSISPRMS